MYQVNASDPSAISDGYIFGKPFRRSRKTGSAKRHRNGCSQHSSHSSVNPAWIASEPNPAFQSGPCIYKQDGELVWGGAEQGFILNGQFEMQEYNNEPVLVVFNGTSTGQGITSGFYFILNQNYEVRLACHQRGLPTFGHWLAAMLIQTIPNHDEDYCEYVGNATTGIRSPLSLAG